MAKDKLEKSYSIPQNKINKPIREWRFDERPRERLLHNGASTLSDAELLAIIISTGTKNTSALDLARNLLEKFQSLSALAARDISELKSIKGIGSAKAITLSAVFEISRRIQSLKFEELPIIKCPEDIANYFIPQLMGLKQERFYIVLLNSSNRIIRIKQVTEGTLNASLVHPHEVFRFAITETAASIILVHNHPSGNPTPSKDDIEMTKKLIEAGKLIDIPILDHLIISERNFTSFARIGLL